MNVHCHQAAQWELERHFLSHLSNDVREEKGMDVTHQTRQHELDFHNYIQTSPCCVRVFEEYLKSDDCSRC